MNGTMMTPEVDIQRACPVPDGPADSQLVSWVGHALATANTSGELTLRITDEQEIQTLNRDFRGKDSATNVLSFPFQMPEGLPADMAPALLGDIIICAPIVEREAREQGKPGRAHWAHMVTHGVLHLLGYDHMTDSDAQIMEAMEIRALEEQGFSDPYRTPD